MSKNRKRDKPYEQKNRPSQGQISPETENAKKKGKEEIKETLDPNAEKKMHQELESLYGKNPSKEDVLKTLQKNAPDVFKDVKSYDDAMTILKEGRKEGLSGVKYSDDSIKVGASRHTHERLQKNVKKEDSDIMANANEKDDDAAMDDYLKEM